MHFLTDNSMPLLRREDASHFRILEGRGSTASKKLRGLLFALSFLRIQLVYKCKESYRGGIRSSLKVYLIPPTFMFQILASIESIGRALPKITRSASEPMLNRFKPSAELDMSFPCPTPHTPIQGASMFNFYPGQMQLVS